MKLLRTTTALLLCLLSACVGPASSETDRTTVRVFAAASLTNVFQELERSFEMSNDDLNIELNIAGSSALRSQILDGAPADVFASANEETMRQVIEGGAVTTQPSIFATNRLVIAVEADNRNEIRGLTDFERSELFIGLCLADVPCGALAEVAMTEAGIEPQVDSFELDVRALVTKISEGELDAGLVYITDVLADDAVTGIELPSAGKTVASYPIATVDDGPAGQAADRFVDFVLSEDGRTILAEFGFGTP